MLKHLVIMHNSEVKSDLAKDSTCVPLCGHRGGGGALRTIDQYFCTKIKN